MVFFRTKTNITVSCAMKNTRMIVILNTQNRLDFHMTKHFRKEYHRSVSPEDYEREREVQRFYRGSSKERRHYQQEHYQHEREYNDR